MLSIQLDGKAHNEKKNAPFIMTIAILIHPFGRFGGAERLAILHAVGLTETGYDVAFYTDTSSLSPAWLSFLTSHVPVRHLPYGIQRRKTIRELDGFDKLLIHHHVEPLAAMQIVQKCAGKTYWYTGEVLRAIWENQITGRDYRQFSPTVYSTARHFYGRLYWLPLWGPLYGFTASTLRWIDMVTVRRYAGIIANSHYMADLVRRVYHYSGPMSVAYPASSLPSSMFRPNYGGGEYVLIVGALMPNKNHLALLEALSLLNRPPALRIVGDGQENNKLREEARNLGVVAKFESNIGAEELCNIYERSLFVVIPSLSEPFGMTALEAALAGKPSVVTLLGGAKEFVVDQETGFVVDPRMSKDFAFAMDRLLSDESLRKNMGQKARQRAVDLFTLENSTTALSKALNL